MLAHNPEVSGSKLSPAISPPSEAKCNISPCYFSNLVHTYENECPQHPFITFTFKCQQNLALSSSYHTNPGVPVL